jgi:hypothetical protein
MIARLETAIAARHSACRKERGMNEKNASVSSGCMMKGMRAESGTPASTKRRTPVEAGERAVH